MTTKKDLTIDQGFTWNFYAEYVEPDETPIDLTGHTVTLYVRRVDGTVIYSKAATVGNGFIEVEVADEETALFPAAPLRWQLTHDQPDGDRYRLGWGELKVVIGL